MKAVKVINDNICNVESRQKGKEKELKAMTGHWGFTHCEISPALNFNFYKTLSNLYFSEYSINLNILTKEECSI